MGMDSWELMGKGSWEGEHGSGFIMYSNNYNHNRCTSLTLPSPQPYLRGALDGTAGGSLLPFPLCL